jgi:hypothetical protein
MWRSSVSRGGERALDWIESIAALTKHPRAVERQPPTEANCVRALGGLVISIVPSSAGSMIRSVWRCQP